MEVFSLLKKEIKEPIRPLVLFIFISGLSNALLISVINNAAEHVSNSEVNNKVFLLYIIGVAVFLFAKKHVMDRSTLIVESIMYKIKYRIADKIRHTQLSTLEAVGVSPLYARLTQDTAYISNVSTSLIGALQSIVLVIFTVLYISTISIWSFMMVIGALILGVMDYLRREQFFITIWTQLSIKETGFFEVLGHILNGFKEIKMNRRKNEAVFDEYKVVNQDLRKHRTIMGNEYNVQLIYSQTFFYFLIGGILFIIPQFHAEHAGDIMKVTTAVLFIVGPMEAIVNSVQMLGNANNSTKNIIALEKQLEEELKKNQLDVDSQNKPEAYEKIPFFENIHLKNLIYSYPPTKENEHVFTVGPINLTFKKGELIFITGGNGSGKSTFLKLLTGLYPPQAGQIALDAMTNEVKERPITAHNYQQFRNLFSTIFTDFHLFDRIYGVDEVPPSVVNRLLRNMELPEEKITYANEQFTNLHLSSGQKKRLALTVSILEDKDIYIFDEVAADLDPDFRDKYYYELLTELKERQKTVIVVSHDRHYWTVPDRLFEMTNGAIRELTKEEINSLLALNKE